MNLDELWGLSEWFERAIVSPNIHGLYNNLANVVRQNAQPNQPRAAIESQKTTLLTALRQMDLSDLTRDQIGFLSDIGIATFLGENGARTVEEILFQGALDIVTAGQRLQGITAKISEAIERFNQIREGLEGVVTPSAAPILKEKEVLLRVTFAGDASISNVVNLKDWSDGWHNIARGIAMAHGEAPEAVRVVGAARGSIILELATCAVIAHTASTIILAALNVSTRYVALLQEVEKLKTMRLSNRKIATELQKEADKERSEGVTQISNDVVKKLGLKKDGEGDKVTALESAIKTLVNFLTKGGDVDCVVPEESSDSDDDAVKMRAALRQNFQEIRSLEADLRRIEHKPDDGGDGKDAE